MRDYSLGRVALILDIGTLVKRSRRIGLIERRRGAGERGLHVGLEDALFCRDRRACG